MTPTGEPVNLGAVTVPSGLLVLLDPAFAGEFAEQPAERGTVDAEIVGEDAVEAGRTFDRQADPRFLYDLIDFDGMRQLFDQHAAHSALRAELRQLDAPVAHLDRARSAAAFGEGVGEFQFDGLWGVAISGLARGPHPLRGFPLPDDHEFGGRWQCVEIVFADDADIEATEEAGLIMVDAGLLMVADAEALGHWHEGDEDEGDYRGLLTALDDSDHDAAELQIAESQALGFSNRWGDGLFAVEVDRAADGSVAVLRFLLGTEERMELTRKVFLRARGVVVSSRIADDGAFVRFAERNTPLNPNDSGWGMSSGEESEEDMNDPDAWVVMRLSDLIAGQPELDGIVDAPVGSYYELVGEEFVRVEREE